MYTIEEHKIIGKLKKHGIYITQNRVTLYRLLSKHKEAVSVTYINKHFIDTLDRISIYRILKLFISKGVLLKVPNAESEATYIFSDIEKVSAGANKKIIIYFICLSCRKMSLLNDSIELSFKPPPNLKIEGCQLIIKGVCKKCKKPGSLK